MRIFTSSYGRMRRMMTKIASNVRGDSGLSDSQLIRSQKFFFKKTQKALDELEKNSIMESNRRRFQANAKPPERKQGFWSKIISWLRGK